MAEMIRKEIIPSIKLNGRRDGIDCRKIQMVLLLFPLSWRLPPKCFALIFALAKKYGFDSIL